MCCLTHWCRHHGAACLPLRSYEKGLVAEVSQFLFGDGFAVASGDKWKGRRKAVGPSLHRCDGGGAF